MVIGFRKNKEIREIIEEILKIKKIKEKTWENLQCENPLEVDPLEWIRLSKLNILATLKILD